jgi:hypothetical protein
MLRHAHAPGNGDPPGFRIDDCATQRNLDARWTRTGPRPWAQVGKGGGEAARVYSSQWCRCLETARLLGLGEPRQLPALNSFYPAPQERESRLAELRAFLASQPIDGPLLVLVTHQFTISGLTDAGTPSAGGTLFQLNGTGNPRQIRNLVPE